MGARSEDKAKASIENIKREIPGAMVEPLLMDLMDLSSVVAAAKRVSLIEQKLHGLVNNAGIMAVPTQMTKDGYESQWQVTNYVPFPSFGCDILSNHLIFKTNYLSHWLLTRLLLPLLLSTAASSPAGIVRVTNVSSVGHKQWAPSVGIDFEDINQTKSGPWSRYGQSKLGNILHSKELLRRYGPGGSELQLGDGEIWTASVHPGNIDT